MAKPAKLAHVVYMTNRYDEMLEWYQNVFEASVQYANPAFAFLTFDDEHHRFAFANMAVLSPNDGPPAEMPHGVGVNHVGYTFANAGELLDNYDRLKRLGIVPYWGVHHGVTLSMYYQDPDGNRMEFQVDRFDDAAEANKYMQSDEFAANPVGVDYDIDELLARYRGGADLATLMAQPEGPMAQIPPQHGL